MRLFSSGRGFKYTMSHLRHRTSRYSVASRSAGNSSSLVDPHKGQATVSQTIGELLCAASWPEAMSIHLPVTFQLSIRRPCLAFRPTNALGRGEERKVF